MSGRSRATVLVAVALLAVVGTGLGVAAAATPGGDLTDTGTVGLDTTDERLALSEVDKRSQPDTDATVDPTLADDTGETTVILSVDRGATFPETASGPLLQANSDATLGPVASEVESLGAATVQNRITLGNLLVVDINLDVHSVDELARIDGVERITPNVQFRVPESPGQLTTADGEVGATGGSVSPASEHGFTYGLEQIDVPGFEEEFNGERGGNATVAVVDNGISNPDEGHPDLNISKKYLVLDGNVTEGVLLEGSHGEHTAGTATGAANPAGDVPRYGVAPEAELIMLDVFGDTPGASFTDIGIALNISAFDENADVAGFSLGADPTDPNAEARYNPIFTDIVADANDVGMAASISSGNAGLGAVGSPGSDFLSMSVGASNSAGGIAGFSSGGVVSNRTIQQFADEPEPRVLPGYFPRKYVKPDVAAPGVDVLSAGPLGTIVDDPNATYSLSQGTSMAQPHVAGAIALLQSATSQQLPPEQIQTALAETAEKPDLDGVRELNGRDTRYGAGIINVTAAGLALQNSQTVEGTVTDADGEALVGATVGTDAAGLTSARGPDGSYTLYTTQDPASVTADAFGYEPETVQVSGGTTTDFTLNQTVEVDLVDGQPVFATFDGEFTVTVDVANLENLTVDLTAESDVPAENVTVLLDGTELTLGETFAFNGSFDGVANLTVNIAGSGTVSEGDLLGLEHTFEGAGDSVTVETGPTELTETLDPPEYEVGNLTAPDNLVLGNTIPVSFEITNVGQQTPDSYGYQFFADNGETAINLPATQLNIAPGETETISVNVAGVEDFYEAGEVITHGARVGVYNPGGFFPPSIDPVEDNVTAGLALQAEGTQFNVVDLDAPLNANPGESIDVTATIENVGETGATQNTEFVFAGDVVANASATLDAFTLAGGVDNTTVTFQNIQLPNVEDYFEHGVFTEDDSAEAPIAVGLPFQNVTVTQSGDAQGELTTDLLTESLQPRYGIPTVVDAANVTDSVITGTDVFLFHDLGDAAPDIIPAVEEDPLTNAVYLEQWTSSNAIADRVDVLNDPEGAFTEFNDAPPVEFTIEQDHPIFDGVGGPGDVVPIHSGGDADFVWFENASGETLATVDDQNTTDENFGPSVAVDPDSGAVLLSSIATVTSFAGDITPADFTPEASQILANAVEFAEPDELEEPFFQVSNLSAPAEAGTGEAIDVSATVTNLGNQTGTQTVEFVFDGSVVANTTVELNASEQTTVEFNGIPLPGQTSTYTHGVFTDNDSQTAEILVGDFTTVTVVEFGETFGEGVDSLLAGNLPDNFNTQILNADDVTDSVISNTDIFVFNDLSGEAGTEERRPRSDDLLRASDRVTGNDVSVDTAEIITAVEAQATTGAVYLDQWGSTSDAIVNRSSAIGDPAETFDEFDSDNPTIEYVIEQDSPLFDGVGSQGDVVELYTVDFGDHSWFEGADGDTLATVQNGAGSGGPAATVDPDSGSVLLSSLGVTTFVGPADYTTEAEEILANGVEVAQPPEFSGDFFDVTGLTAPAQADAGASINVSATVTNVGNETGTQTVEFVFDGSVAASTTVELDPGNETVVEFTDVALPSEGGVFEHGVQTANDSQFAEITVGSPDIELVELNQPDELTLEQEITTEITLTNNGTAPYEGEVLQVTNLNDTAPDTGAVGIAANATAFTLDPGESMTFSDNLGTFAGINSALDTNFEPGDQVETGYERGQNLAEAFEPGGDPTIEEVYSEEISIVEPALFNVSDLSAPAEAGPGESINVSATVTNTGGLADTQTVEFVFDGTVAASTTVELNASEQTTVEFTPSVPEQLGTYEHGVQTANDSAFAEITVTAPPEVGMASIDIAGQGDDATVLAGAYDVAVEMNHTGGGPGEVTMNLSIGETESSQTVQIGVNETVTVAFENATAGLDPGNYGVTASAVNASITGNLTLSVDTGDNDAPASDTDGDGNLDDVDGDGDTDITDVQALFDALGDSDVQAGAELFDFANMNDDRVSVFDVQALFTDISS